jgi:hypothetical protein
MTRAPRAGAKQGSALIAWRWSRPARPGRTGVTLERELGTTAIRETGERLERHDHTRTGTVAGRDMTASSGSPAAAQP